jgi:hypothetical protein
MFLTRKKLEMRYAIKIYVVLGLIYLTLPAVAAVAAPPVPGLQPNSLEVESQGRRYRPQRRTVSPFLALTPGGLGNLAAINYFNVVQPEVQQLQINQQQYDALLKLEGKGPGPAMEEGEELGTVPKERASYMTHHKYFAQPINQAGLKKADKK